MLESAPVCLLLDSITGDLSITAGRTSFTSGLTAAVQGARARMGLIRGEWFLNIDAGVPYFERDNVATAAALLGQPYDALKVRAAMRAAILSTPAISEIILLNVEQDPTTRTVTVTWQARTLFGDTPVDVLES